ncbi:hypothetical protein FDZ73_21390 [bacterium]|nr:MAG: hypothetical protein FDZ73_21390 [bacterium]
MKLPDVIGFPLDEAIPVIAACGFTVSQTLTTQPVKAIGLLGPARVVRVKCQEDAKLQIVVAYEDYLKGGV